MGKLTSYTILLALFSQTQSLRPSSVGSSLTVAVEIGVEESQVGLVFEKSTPQGQPKEITIDVPRVGELLFSEGSKGASRSQWDGRVTGPSLGLSLLLSDPSSAQASSLCPMQMRTRLSPVEMALQ